LLTLISIPTPLPIPMSASIMTTVGPESTVVILGNVMFCNWVTTAYAAISGCFTPDSRINPARLRFLGKGSSVLDMEYFEFLSTYSCYLRKSIQETINKEESFTELDDVFWGIQNKIFLVITQLLGVLRNNHSQTLLAPHPLTSLLTKWSEYIRL